MKICQQCQHQNQPDANFCNNCGANLQTGESIDSPKQSPKRKRPAERRQLTILFCDLVDSTALSEKMDPEEYRQIITDYHKLVEQVIKEYKGHIAHYLGDGLVVYFGYPVGLEDAPRVAVSAGLEVLRAITKASDEWSAAGSTAIKVRIGIHTGLTVVDEHLALGEAVNVAARLESLAPHNGLVVSAHTNHLISGWFEVKSIGSHTLKGISEPMEIFQVLEETGAASSLDIAKHKGLTPMVGRDQDLQKIQEYWKQAKKGRTELVVVNGEPGIGKSRLLDVVIDQVSTDPDGKLLLARSYMHRQYSAFFPLIEMLENQVFKFAARDDHEKRLEKLTEVANQLNLDHEVVIPILAELLSISSEKHPVPAMSPFAKRQKTIAGLVQSIINFSREKPLMLVLEDLHWADASTLEWLGFLLRQKQDSNFLILCSSRPEFNLDSLGASGIKQIDLKRLSVEDTASICQHQTKGKTLPQEVLGEIAVKTEGVPLFVEELTKTILEGELLVEQADRYQVVKPVSSLSIPTTLQDSLLARLDRLDEIKEIVQVGAVIGREFTLEILNEIIPEPQVELEPSLSKLLEVDILRHHSSDEKSVYQFKHSLIQDAAYDSLLKSERKKIHQQVAAALENKFAETSGQQPELMAHHYTEAGELVKAIPLWLQAGQKASKNNATAEAANHLEKGISLLDDLDETPEYKEWELDLMLTLGGTYVVSLGFPHPKVKETFDKARDIAQSMGASPKLALILFNLLSYYFNTEDYQSADELRDHMFEIAKDSEHGYWFELFAIHLGEMGQLIRGNFQVSVQAFEKEMKMFRPELPFPWELTPSGYIEIGAKGWYMLACYVLGDFEQAKSLSDSHLQYAEDHKDSVTLYHIYTFPALYKLEAREWKEAEQILDQYLPMVKEFGDPVFTLTAEVYYNIARAFQGDEQAFEQAVQSLNFCFQIGFKAFAVSLSPHIGEYYTHLGRHHEAITFIDRILEHANLTGTHIHTAELARIKGLALLGLGEDQDKAEHWFRQAIEIAKDQSAKTFELRASCDLAKLWHGQGKKTEAHELVESVYNSFTDGAASVDMAEATDLIKELAH